MTYQWRKFGAIDLFQRHFRDTTVREKKWKHKNRWNDTYTFPAQVLALDSTFQTQRIQKDNDHYGELSYRSRIPDNNRRSRRRIKSRKGVRERWTSEYEFMGSFSAGKWNRGSTVLYVSCFGRRTRVDLTLNQMMTNFRKILKKERRIETKVRNRVTIFATKFMRACLLPD